MWVSVYACVPVYVCVITLPAIATDTSQETSTRKTTSNNKVFRCFFRGIYDIYLFRELAKNNPCARKKTNPARYTTSSNSCLIAPFFKLFDTTKFQSQQKQQRQQSSIPLQQPSSGRHNSCTTQPITTVPSTTSFSRLLPHIRCKEDPTNRKDEPTHTFEVPHKTHPL